ncbi:MAG: SDR family NAD(P)-dependent oxidoreductase [Psychroflexus sp.]|nr:SDR family NAD(P)-dependent oxidoreductase [Psychroflexus sp.]MDR9448771.1 SDR family NAD(P)-dependent oxidoreductase [Psychroflexus sp.]
MNKETVLITGATSGIGKAAAYKLAQHYNLILCGRRKDRLENLKASLAQTTDVHLLNFDIRDRKACHQAVSQLPEAFAKIDVLINNAGNAHGLSLMQDADIDDWDQMIDINVKGLLYISQPIMKQMEQNDHGHIINIGSIAGQDVYPKGNVYCATKHAVIALTKSMRYDLHDTNVKVGVINPGLVETEFSEVRFKGDKERASQTYQGYKALEAKDIANSIFYMLQQPEHVNISEMTVLPSAQSGRGLLRKSDVLN